MVITDQFVYIHQPKTGGTFVTHTLLDLYRINWNKWGHLKLAVRGWVEWQGQYGLLRIQDKHGGCRRIPGKYQDRAVFSTVRNPWDYYVSQYEFGWWKRREWMKYYRKVPDADLLLKGFPDISFEQYLRLMVASFNKPANQDFDNPDQIGHYTTSFMRLFSKNPKAENSTNIDHYFREDQFREDLFAVDFLTTSGLNRQLYNYFRQLDYAPSDLDFILQKEKVLPQGKGRSKDQKWQKYYSDELRQLIWEKDAPLFRLIPQFTAIQH